jgi:hypothetical protein
VASEDESLWGLGVVLGGLEADEMSALLWRHFGSCVDPSIGAEEPGWLQISF